MKDQLTQLHKDTLQDLIYTTLDFCGSTFRAVKEYCKENNLFHNDEIEQFRGEIILKYYGET